MPSLQKLINKRGRHAPRAFCATTVPTHAPKPDENFQRQNKANNKIKNESNLLTRRKMASDFCLMRTDANNVTNLQ